MKATSKNWQLQAEPRVVFSELAQAKTALQALVKAQAEDCIRQKAKLEAMREAIQEVLKTQPQIEGLHSDAQPLQRPA